MIEKDNQRIGIEEALIIIQNADTKILAGTDLFNYKYSFRQVAIIVNEVTASYCKRLDEWWHKWGIVLGWCDRHIRKIDDWDREHGKKQDSAFSIFHELRSKFHSQEKGSFSETPKLSEVEASSDKFDFGEKKKCKYPHLFNGQECCIREALVNKGDIEEANCPCKDFEKDKNV